MGNEKIAAFPAKDEADPFDPENLKIDQLGDAIATEKVLLTVPVRKPARSEFFQVNPDPAYSVETVILEYDREVYLIDRALWPSLSAEIKPVKLYTCITRTGTVFLWNVRVPGVDGRGSRWWDTAHEVAEEAKTTWVRCCSNHDLGGYDMVRAVGTLLPPSWPSHRFRDLLELAFKGKLIKNADHHIIKRLQGEI